MECKVSFSYQYKTFSIVVDYCQYWAANELHNNVCILCKHGLAAAIAIGPYCDSVTSLVQRSVWPPFPPPSPFPTLLHPFDWKTFHRTGLLTLLTSSPHHSITHAPHRQLVASVGGATDVTRQSRMNAAHWPVSLDGRQPECGCWSWREDAA